eukprot:CAMPEP_0174377852 /NCGR_PEP_ID=MMETSP0811_2-20130205/121678_1 /TAXON_ID=73025 ORGANISM="Eutreptiella gymnastica-like, Strain CCMP1594" /NCGR_SAMPLE_ID=MMETSP0811_2 /ASSEMBLY_ACC=CAM_ASM_000667 /LENGTH=246 /DNA_ID=CAMNT_0015529939 /DNA_START=593 /DNA_END=1334 /DNA_ORIENTATION=-
MGVVVSLRRQRRPFWVPSVVWEGGASQCVTLCVRVRPNIPVQGHLVTPPPLCPPGVNNWTVSRGKTDVHICAAGHAVRMRMGRGIGPRGRMYQALRDWGGGACLLAPALASPHTGAQPSVVMEGQSTWHCSIPPVPDLWHHRAVEGLGSLAPPVKAPCRSRRAGGLVCVVGLSFSTTPKALCAALWSDGCPAMGTPAFASPKQSPRACTPFVVVHSPEREGLRPSLPCLMGAGGLPSGLILRTLLT